jgi:hypothetical protein
MTRREFWEWLLNQGTGENLYDPWLTAKAAAALYGVSISTIYRRVKSGTLEKSQVIHSDGKGLRVRPPGFHKPRRVVSDEGRITTFTPSPDSLSVGA